MAPSEDNLLDTYRPANQTDFGKFAEQHRHELRVHCYRMLGSFQDAEDMVQETFLRAWQKLNMYEGRGSFRAWLYKIATNACLDALDRRPKRTLPAMHQEASDPTELPEAPVTEPIWLEPIPDDVIGEIDSGPEARCTARESITLAFLAALQLLPPRQRAILILRDVLDWQASQVAESLELTLSAVNSALHRARSTLAKNYRENEYRSSRQAQSDAAMRALLDRYVSAWENADLEGLVALLKEDAVFTMPPSPSWYRGKEAIRTFIANVALAGDARGRYRFVQTRANGQPAFGWYQRDDASGEFRGFAIQVLTFGADLISDVATFMIPDLLPRFGLTMELSS